MKQIIVMNGKGGVGKDTLCDGAAERYQTMNVSSIDPIKAIARQNGWDGGKDDASRRFLSELKRVFTEYNDLPTRYLKEKVQAFLEGDYELLFVHIRESSEIRKFVEAVKPVPCVTILIRRAAVDVGHVYGNRSDDDVENYNYDHIFHNDLPIEESSAQFVALLESLEK